MLIQSIFYPFEMVSKRREGVSLKVHTEGPVYESKSYGTATFMDTGAVLNKGRLHVFVTNRDTEEKAELTIKPLDFAISSLADAEILTGTDPRAANSFEKRDAVISREFDAVRISGGKAVCELPPLSFAAMTFKSG